MHHTKFPFLVATLLVVACSTDPDPTENNTHNDVGVDAVFDTDTGGDFDTDAGESDNSDADSGADADADGPPAPEPWDCDPDFPLDAERYVHLEETTGSELSTELFLLVDDQFNRGYGNVRDLLFNQLEVRDDGLIECVYTGRRVEPDGTRTPDGFNTEHTWPRSRGASQEPELSDLHHLFPVDAVANNERANFEFGHVSCNESTCPWHEGGSFLGPSADDNRDPIFEVRPQRRGDIARAILYYSIRYGADVSSDEEAVLRQWNCEDPPDQHERTRNSNIEQVQSNRNPFIDRPDFVDRIDEFRNF